MPRYKVYAQIITEVVFLVDEETKELASDNIGNWIEKHECNQKVVIGDIEEVKE